MEPQLPRRQAAVAAAGAGADGGGPIDGPVSSQLPSHSSPRSHPTVGSGFSSPVDGPARSQPPSHSSPRTHQLSRDGMEDLRIVRQLSVWAVLAHIGGQVAPLLAWPQLPAGERAQRLAGIALMLGFHLLLHAAPSFYLRHSTQLQVALRLAYYAFPLLRKPRGIQSMLNREATPGSAGALLDILRVAWGTRLMAVLLTSLITPLRVLPLVPNLLLQVYSVAMVRNNSTLCAAPLLAHPLTRRRVQALHRFMDVLLFMLPSGTLLLPGGTANQEPGTAKGIGGGSQQAAAAAAQCEGALNFLAALLGLLLPLIFLIKTEDAASLARLQARLQPQHELPHRSGMLGRLAAAWHRAEAAAEAALRSLVGCSWLAAGPPLPGPLLGGDCERWLAWVQLLAMTWAWCAAPTLASAAAST